MLWPFGCFYYSVAVFGQDAGEVSYYAAAGDVCHGVDDLFAFVGVEQFNDGFDVYAGWFEEFVAEGVG